MKKRYIIILICIFLIIFSFFYYNFFINGNNIFKKSDEEIIDNILNADFNYTAEANVTIYSNKNQNTYEIKQEETKEHSFLEVISDGDIKGLNLEYEENKLILKNTELNLEKIFENYNELSSNYLFLKSFIKEYLESEDIKILEDNENTIVVKITLLNSNKYIKYKELYIDRKTELPKKLIIKNSDKQIKVCIIYNNIEILQ